MNEQLDKLKEQLLQKVFYYTESGTQAKTFFCKGIEYKNHRFVIDCDVRKFVFLPGEVDGFLNSIRIETSSVSIPAATMMQPINQNVANVSDALFEMFNKVASKKASKKDLENAKLMIGLSNQLVSIEKIKLGYYNLQKK